MESPNHATRAHALLSASSAELWINCPGSAIANAQYGSDDNAFTQEGTIAHEVAQVYAEAYANNEGHSTLAAGLQELRDRYGRDMSKEMEDCAEQYALYISEHAPAGSLVELETRVDFSHWVPDGFGTCDCFIVNGSELTVIDYKYGKGVEVSAERNPQMMLYALGAMDCYDMLCGFDKVNLVIFQPRIDNISEYTIDYGDLIAWAANTVFPAAANAYSDHPIFCAGKHCKKFCKHAGRCPELARYCTDFVESHGLRVAVPHLTDDDYLEIFKTGPVIKAWLAAVEKKTTERILNGEPVRGLRVVEGRSARQWVDEDSVGEELRKQFDPDEFMEPAKVMSVAALEKSLGKKAVASIVGNLITKAPGKPTLVLTSDKRPDYDPSADFDSLD